ncbi:Imm71 family immunity protein [Luteimonas sp. MJ250]|uniref:Imm71 family immunity protein n=1 Tax=Luteimonas sp. MJ250 TaxID=3129236 RepID=UPI0031BB0B77
MNAPLAREDVLQPDDHERKQIFYWLKQVSSWTAWNRILTSYKAWADVAEKSVRIADNTGVLVKSSIRHNDYVFILNGLAHFEEGVERLRQGDKRVFQYNAHGEFVMAGRAPRYWGTMIWGRGEMQTDYENTPHWDDFEQTLKEFNAISGECAVFILEKERLDAPAPNFYGIWQQESMPKLPFPTSLPDVPDPAEDVLICTGKTLPFSGIWEPVEVPKPKGFSLFKHPPPRGPFPIIGCMNYLHGGSAAPRATQRTGDSEELHHADVTWRLLWRDNRYEDGAVPNEECEYRFLQPVSFTPTRAAEVALSSIKSNPLVTARSGHSAPHSGRWLPEDDLAGAIELQTGQTLPFRDGRSILWTLADRR